MEGGEVGGGGGEVCEEWKGFKVGEKVGGAAAAAAVEVKVGPGDKKGETAAAAADYSQRSSEGSRWEKEEKEMWFQAGLV